jgi:hypothetical protein
MRSLAVVGFFVLAGTVVACGAKHNNGDDDDTDGGAGSCSPACGSGQFCSAAGYCVQDGQCGSDSDCPDGTFCSGNQACVTVGKCGVDADCAAGMMCGSDGNCALGGCGGTHLDLTYVPPNFILALDRSCSMTQKLTGTMTTKWEAAVAAINHVLTTYATDIRWGATLFPDTAGSNCTQGTIPFPVADNNGPAISTALTAALGSGNALYPNNPCVTNIDTGVEQAATDPALSDTDRASFVMLVTDGSQSACSAGSGNAGTEAAIAALLVRGIKTFVVGFGSEVNVAEMNKFATDGGTALTGTTKYYEADTADALDTAFQSIAALTVSCSYTVNPAPTDLDETYVYFSGTELVPRDPTHMLGWDYDPTTMQITIYGDDCNRLKARTVTQVDVIFGCPTPPIN